MPRTRNAFTEGDNTVIDRGDLYVATRENCVFEVTSTDPSDAGVTGQTAFDATTPTFMYYQAAGARRSILRSISLSQTGTVAGGPIEIAVAVDTANRFSAGGTAVVPLAPNTENTTVTPTPTFVVNATATAAGAGTRYLKPFTVPAVVGSPFVISFADDIMIGATGSILIYTWAATTGPTWRYTLTTIEETI